MAGTIEVGKRADLVLLAANPLDDVRNARTPVGVMARGRWFPAVQLDTMLARVRRD
jgi:imidazolonepropionase-like amidohydrolase